MKKLQILSIYFQANGTLGVPKKKEFDVELLKGSLIKTLESLSESTLGCRQSPGTCLEPEFSGTQGRWPSGGDRGDSLTLPLRLSVIHNSPVSLLAEKTVNLRAQTKGKKNED